MKRFASPKGVYDGEAKYVGELMFGCNISVNYCPICGENLIITETELNLASAKKQEERQSAEFHQCEPLEKHNKVHSKIGTSQDSNGVWRICKTIQDDWCMKRYAVITKQMVEDKVRGAREADIGTEQFLFGIGINYCPFCGKQFDEPPL